MWVIVRTDGFYVAPPGRERSYTPHLEGAWGFPTKEAAERQRCVENERVVAVSEILKTQQG